MKKFRCYSANMKKFLIDKGFKYLWVDVSKANGKTFWMFELTDELSQALTEWTNNKPR